jgi:hypothetical protein
MKKSCFTVLLLSALIFAGVALADENFGVNPPMVDPTAATESSVARDLAERGLVPLDGEGWAKRPILPAAGYNAEGTADTSPPASVSKPNAPTAPVAPKAPKM